MALLALVFPPAGMAAQSVAAGQIPGQAAAPQSAEELYSQLRSVGLDAARVYRIREAAIDRSAIHISLEDGTIAFTADVEGRVTGAYFEGSGEVLLMPPNQVERESMALFTHAAILEEQFGSAYFRFNDDTYAALRPFLRPAENGQEFAQQWNETARNLAAGDALRLLLDFSKLLPVSAGAAAETAAFAAGNEDRLLHARLQGRSLGTFDVYFDSAAPEQVWAGQLRTTEGTNYYNVWSSFAVAPSKPHAMMDSATAENDSSSGAFHISSYRIRVEVTPPTQLKADAHLQLEVDKGGERAALFELSRFLQVQRVEVNGHPAAFIHNPAIEGTQLERQGNDLLAVVFPGPLRAGEKVELHFVYQGDVLSEAGGGLLYVGARGVWYPNRGLAMANFDLEFHYPKGWTLIATGNTKEMPQKNGENGASSVAEEVSRWVSERAIPLAGFNLGKYSRAQARAGNVEVDTYAASAVERSFPRIAKPVPAPLPPLVPLTKGPVAELVPLVLSPARNAAAVSDRAARAVNFFSERFGPFPYRSLSLTQMPGLLSQGWPGLVFLSTYAFLTPEEQTALQMTPVERIRNQGVIGHETAHQWWGDLVTWSSYRDQWVIEGLAEYSSLMFLESENPAAFKAVLEKYRDDLMAKTKDGTPMMDAGPVTLGNRLSNSQFPGGYITITYERGAWLFHMLRTMMLDASQKAGPRSNRPQSGADPFVQALHRLRDRYQGKAVTTTDLLRELEAELPRPLQYEGRKSLDWFYSSWINGTAIPRLELQGVKYTDRAGSTLVRGTILQSEAPEDFVTSVPVYASIGGKEVLLGRVFADGASTEFRLTAPSHTRKVLLDPRRTLLTRNR